MKKVSIVNKFGPFSKAITGRNAKELADYLVLHNIEVVFHCLTAEYKSEEANTKLPGVRFKVKELRNFYQGSSAMLRLLWGFIDGCRLWLSSFHDKSDAVIVMTDPPLLIFWFQLFRGWSKRKLFYWTMDLYPEAFAAGRYIRPGNIFYKFFHSVVYRRAPELLIALGREQFQFLENKFRTPLKHVILPCGIIARTPIKQDESGTMKKIIFGYGGNIGEAHDAEFIISLVNQLNPEQHSIVLSLYGAKAAYVKARIGNSKAVEFKSFLDYSDIEELDVNVATILPEWNHVCVPSKAVTAICCGSSLLLNASRDTDAWNMFRQASWLVEPAEDYHAGIANAISMITRDAISQKKLVAKTLASDMVEKQQNALAAIVLSV